MQLNKDQSNLIDALRYFYFKSHKKFFILSGQAGVGKTTCMKYFKDVVKSVSETHKICMSAPTNKATSVLRESILDSDVTYKTIYSILGLRMMANGELKELKDTGEERITNFDLVVIDEASMINSELIEIIKQKTAIADTKIIMIGDKEQLPPVGELVSPIWEMFDTDYELTEVMRHQNSILDFVQSIRANPNPEFVSPGEQVIIPDETAFMKSLDKMAEQGMFHDGNAKAIAWRNVTVDFLNKHIRSMNSITRSNQLYVPGDRIVFREPIFDGKKSLASTDEEATVSSVKITKHLKYPNLKAWKLALCLDRGETITSYIIHDDSKDDLQTMLEEFKEIKRWDMFWNLKEAFHSISYAYAITAHRSQGSSFKYVYVDAGDIMLNRNVTERTKCLYVACSRASKLLTIFP